MLGHILLTVLGLLLSMLGFWSGHVWPKPYGALVVWCVPVGLDDFPLSPNTGYR